MARSQRHNVDFFLHKCSHGKRMKYLENEYGNDGYATWFKILEQLGKENYHFIHLENDLDTLMLADFCIPHMSTEKQSQFQSREKLLLSIINDMVKLGIFHRELWEKYKILWCQEFVSSLKYVYDKRGSETPSLKAIRAIKGISVTETIISDTETTDSDTETTTREGKGIEEYRREGKGAPSSDVPSLENIIKYFLENGYSRAAAIKYYEMYTGLGWSDTKGNQIKNWKLKAQKVWFKPEHRASAEELAPQKKSSLTPHVGFKAHGEE